MMSRDSDGMVHELQQRIRAMTGGDGASRRHAGSSWRDRGSRATKLFGGMVGLGLLSALTGDSDDDELQDVPRQRLTGHYVDTLSASVERHMEEGDTLTDALARTLRDRAPILLRQPDVGGSSSTTTWALGLGLTAAAGIGLFMAARRFMQGDDEARGAEPGERYATVHRTSGARMPDVPEERSGYSRRQAGSEGGGMPTPDRRTDPRTGAPTPGASENP